MYTFLTVIHVFVCIFLMLVVLLQAGRGGGIGLAFGGSGGSQSVFGSSGGANFLTKLTAICAIIFFTNSLALAYLSSQSDSRRLQRIAEKKALAKKAEDAANNKLLTEIDKQREAQEKAAAQKSEGTPAEGAATEEKAEGKTDDKAEKVDDKAAGPMKLTMPGAAPAGGKLAGDLKLGDLGKPAAEKADKPVAKKPLADKPATKAPTAEKPAAEKKPTEAPAEKPTAE